MKISAIIFAIIVAIGSVLYLTGCGGNNNNPSGTGAGSGGASKPSDVTNNKPK